jgi:glycerol-3-phosphate dehydrogenase
VLLVEKGDFASGTSSASSRLIHGGLRYLAHGHLGLVYEALSERRTLRRIAPHLVRPLDFLFPVYSGDRHGLTRLRIGVGLYDLLSLIGSEKFHRSLSADGVRAEEPGLEAVGLEGGLLYYDCQVDDARLTLENVIDAHELGAWVVNYVRLDERAVGAGVQELALTDTTTGQSLSARVRVVVNATGPWCDRLAPAGSPPLVRPTKGVHLVFRPGRLPIEHAVVMQSRSDDRIVFAIPWDGHTYMGTTESEEMTDPDRVHATYADVAYLLDVARRYFPSAALTPEDVLSTWAGLRPLIRSDGTVTSASREHRIEEHEPGFLTVAGGKLTTYRRMAREVVDHAAAHLKETRATASGSRTENRPLPGAVDYPGEEGEAELVERLAASRGLDDLSARHLVRTYGARRRHILERIDREPALARRIVPDLPHVRAELPFALDYEMVVQPEDFLVRRTGIFHRAADGGLPFVSSLSSTFPPDVLEDSLNRLQDLLDVSRHRPRSFDSGSLHP